MKKKYRSLIADCSPLAVRCSRFIEVAHGEKMSSGLTHAASVSTRKTPRQAANGQATTGADHGTTRNAG